MSNAGLRVSSLGLGAATGDGVALELGVQDMKNGVSALPHGKYGAITTVNFTDEIGTTMKATSGDPRVMNQADETLEYYKVVKDQTDAMQREISARVLTDAMDDALDRVEEYNAFDPKNWGV